MLIGVYNYHQGKNQNSEMFNNPKIAIGDDLMKPFQILKEISEKNDIKCVVLQISLLINLMLFYLLNFLLYHFY